MDKAELELDSLSPQQQFFVLCIGAMGLLANSTNSAEIKHDVAKAIFNAIQSTISFDVLEAVAKEIAQTESKRDALGNLVEGLILANSNRSKAMRHLTNLLEILTFKENAHEDHSQAHG